MLNWLKLSHHDHSGRLRPHEHTSYLPLALLLLVVGFSLTIYSVSAATPYTGPEEGSIGLTGSVPGAAPTQAAVIAQPSDGQHFSTSPIAISGTCPAGTLVEIFKNDIFTGSTVCLSGGTFAMDIDLLFGQNLIIARVYDDLGQAGPDSNQITIFYDILPPQADPLTPLNLGGAQMLLNTDAVYRGMFPEQEFTIPVDILGGTPPYAVNVQWGDTNNKVVPRPDNASFRVAHVYRKPGNYQISLQATDSTGRVAFLGVAAIVNGQPVAGGIGTTGGDGWVPNQLLVLWPVYTGVAAVLVSFWLGERREKKILTKPTALLPQ